MANESLSLDAINALLAGARSRGDYDGVLSDFLNSGEAGVEVDLSSGPLAGKDPKNVVTGFNNARIRVNKDNGKPVHEGGHSVKVILRTVKEGEGENVTETPHVFLINTAKLGEQNGDASGDTADDAAGATA